MGLKPDLPDKARWLTCMKIAKLTKKVAELHTTVADLTAANETLESEKKVVWDYFMGMMSQEIKAEPSVALSIPSSLPTPDQGKGAEEPSSSPSEPSQEKVVKEQASK
jgi:hypothetical protein